MSDRTFEPRSGPPAIETKQLARSFGDDIQAVAGIDLTVARGEIYGFLGPNGAGKSTTVRMLCTLLAPTGGSATVAGHDIVAEPGRVRLRIGVALQEAALDPKQTGLELLRLQGRLYGLSKAVADQRAHELGALIDLTDALNRPIGGYSGGMKRRLDLAAALVHNPDVLFLDEPTTGLDPVSRATVWAEVQRLNEELEMTIFLTTQYLEEADALADRVGIIDGGTIVAEGTPTELKRNVGADLIVVRVDGDAKEVCDALGRVPGVLGVEAHGHEAVISTDNGSAAVSAVVVALDLARDQGARADAAHADARRRVPRGDRQPHGGGGRSRGLARSHDRADLCRRSTHDDRKPHHRRRLARRAGQARRPDVRHHGHRRARPAGRPARPRGGHPADLHRPVLLPREHRDALEPHREQHPRVRLQGVPAADGDPARCHRRLAGGGAGARRAERLLRPTAAQPGAAHLDPARADGGRRRRRHRSHRADHDRRLRRRRALRHRAARRAAVRPARRAVEPGVHRLRLRDRPEDGEPGRGQLVVPAVLPVPVPHQLVRAPRSAVGVARHRRHVQPGDVPARGAALARSTAAGRGTTSVRHCSPS